MALLSPREREYGLFWKAALAVPFEIARSARRPPLLDPSSLERDPRPQPHGSKPCLPIGSWKFTSAAISDANYPRQRM